MFWGNQFFHCWAQPSIEYSRRPLLSSTLGYTHGPSDFNVIQMTLPMWWCQCPATPIHQSQSWHQCMNRLLAASTLPHWIVTVINLRSHNDHCWAWLWGILMDRVISMWFKWLCQCGDVNVQAHPYIRVKVDISVWIGYWLHPHRHIGSSPSSIWGHTMTIA